MENIANSINSLIVKTYGGLIAFWLAIVYMIVKLLVFLGGCMAEGAINRGIIKIIPIVKAEFKAEFDTLKKEINDVKKSFKSYQDEKHKIENECKLYKSVILSEDMEAQLEIKKFHEKK
jgi:cell shape-determining protein MreC